MKVLVFTDVDKKDPDKDAEEKNELEQESENETRNIYWESIPIIAGSGLEL